MFIESLEKRKSVLKVSRGSMPCYSALFSDDQCTICTCWGVNLPKATKQKAIFLAL